MRRMMKGVNLIKSVKSISSLNMLRVQLKSFSFQEMITEVMLQAIKSDLQIITFFSYLENQIFKWYNNLWDYIKDDKNSIL